MTKLERLRGVGIAFVLLAVPSLAWAQGSEAPRPPGSDPSARVNQLQGLPPPPPGTPGNPTGNAADRPAMPPASNAVPARPIPSATGNPNSGGRTNGPSPSN